jgi:hypothetical protein
VGSVTRPRRPARWPKCAALAALAIGCRHWHFERNAPGHIDVAVAPAADAGVPDAGQHRVPSPSPVADPVEEPRDPGEQVVFVNGGLFGGLGAAAGGTERTSFVSDVGVEASVGYGRSPHSHMDEEPFFTPWPERYLSLNAGSGFTGGDAARFYFEAQGAYRAAGLALGWTIDPEDSEHGPQGTAFFGAFYLRGSHLGAHGTAVTLGIVVKAPLAWYWSQ